MSSLPNALLALRRDPDREYAPTEPASSASASRQLRPYFVHRDTDRLQ